MYYIITCIINDIFNISEIYSHVTVLCIGQIEASTCPPPPPPPAYPGHLTTLPSRGGGNLIIRIFQGVGNLIPML